MQITILNGSNRDSKNFNFIEKNILNFFEGRNCNLNSFKLNEMEIKHCCGCFGCWIKTPGICVIDDNSRNIVKSMIQSDLLIYLTPITFGGYSYNLKKVLDRAICLLSPFFTEHNGEIHHKQRYEKFPNLLAIGEMQEKCKESENIFKELVYRNTINMHISEYKVEIFNKTVDVDKFNKSVFQSLKEIGAL